MTKKVIHSHCSDFAGPKGRIEQRLALAKSCVSSGLAFCKSTLRLSKFGDHPDAWKERQMWMLTSKVFPTLASLKKRIPSALKKMPRDNGTAAGKYPVPFSSWT